MNEIISETMECSAESREGRGVSRRVTSERVVKEDLTWDLNDKQVAMGRKIRREAFWLVQRASGGDEVGVSRGGTRGELRV